MIESFFKESQSLHSTVNDIGNESIIKQNTEIIKNSNPLEYSIPTIENQSLESLKIQNKLASESKELSQFISGMTTRNEDLEGTDHPVTGIPFVKTKIETTNGETEEGVFPVFESEFDAQLPAELYESTDNEQFKECNSQLKEWVDKNHSEAREKFSDEQLEDIAEGNTPEGYTWHHNEVKGKMELVDTEKHAKTAHTGGKSIWGGGNENR